MNTFIAGATIEHAPLETVYIFFDTATFDEIERDVKVMQVYYFIDFWVVWRDKKSGSELSLTCMKVTTEAQLGLILSGVEIIYYLLKFSFPQK